MANPVGLLVGLALAAGLAFVMTSSKSGGAPGAPSGPPLPGGPPLPPVQPGTGKYDSPGGPVMPLQLEQTVDRELASDTNPNSLIEFAQSLTPMWPIAVQALAEQAAVLNVQPSPSPPPPPPPPIPPPVVPPAPTPIAPPVAPPVYVPPPPDPGAPPPVDPGAQGGGASLDPSWGSFAISLPDVSGVTIPSSYKAQSDETQGIQQALNAWASAVGYAGSEIPLTADGKYGPKTRQAVASFQMYMNAAQGAGLKIDGLAGPSTQGYLGQYGQFSTDRY
jgi:hypothetical protein